MVECKILHKGLESTIAQGLEQTAGYMDRSAAKSGHLVIFDRDPGKSWQEKMFHEVRSTAERTIHVWGM